MGVSLARLVRLARINRPLGRPPVTLVHLVASVQSLNKLLVSNVVKARSSPTFLPPPVRSVRLVPIKHRRVKATVRTVRWVPFLSALVLLSALPVLQAPLETSLQQRHVQTVLSAPIKTVMASPSVSTVRRVPFLAVWA